MHALLERFLILCCRLFDQLIGFLLLIMVVLVFGNVVLRYTFDSGITLSEELSRWLFVWMTFLGATVSMQRNAHLGTEFVINRLGASGRVVCALIARLLMLGTCILVAVGAAGQAQINFHSTSAVMEASLAWLDAAVLLFAVFAGLFVIASLRPGRAASTPPASGSSPARTPSK